MDPAAITTAENVAAVEAAVTAEPQSSDFLTPLTGEMLIQPTGDATVSDRRPEDKPIETRSEFEVAVSLEDFRNWMLSEGETIPAVTYRVPDNRNKPDWEDNVLDGSPTKSISLSDRTRYFEPRAPGRCDSLINYETLLQAARQRCQMLSIDTALRKMLVLSRLDRLVENLPKEIPVFSNALPCTAVSHQNDIMQRFNTTSGNTWTGVLDLSFGLTGLCEDNNCISTVLGRRWKVNPYNPKIDVHYLLSPSNYDAADIRILSAFTTIGEPIVPSPKDIHKINTALTFVGLPKINDYTYSMHNNLRMLFDTKPRFARLYWRLIILYLEALVAESVHKEYVITSISSATVPVCQARTEDGFATAVKACVDGENAFFITDRMMTECSVDQLPAIMGVATSMGLSARHRTLLPRPWAPIHGARVYILNTGALTPTRAINCPIILRARDLARVLDYLGGYLDQFDLIFELMKLAASFLMRPVDGDLSYDDAGIWLNFPPAVLTASLALSFAERRNSSKLRNSIICLNKIVWVGTLYRMQLELLMGAVMDYSRYKIVSENHGRQGFIVDSTIDILSSRQGQSNHFSDAMQSLSLRLGWGCTVTRTIGLFDVEALLHKASSWIGGHRVQWSEWLLFGRTLPCTAGILGLLCNCGQSRVKLELQTVQDEPKSNSGILSYSDDWALDFLPLRFGMLQHQRECCLGWKRMNVRTTLSSFLWCRKPKSFGGVLADGFYAYYQSDAYTVVRPFISLQRQEDIVWMSSTVTRLHNVVWLVNSNKPRVCRPISTQSAGLAPDSMGIEPNTLTIQHAINPRIADQNTFDQYEKQLTSSLGEAGILDTTTVDGNLLQQSSIVQPCDVMPEVFVDNVARRLMNLKKTARGIGYVVDQLKHNHKRVTDAVNLEEKQSLESSQIWRAVTMLANIESGTLEPQTILRQRAAEFVNAMSLERPEAFMQRVEVQNRSILCFAIREVADILLGQNVGNVDQLSNARNNYEILNNVMMTCPMLTLDEFAASGFEHAFPLFGSTENVVNFMLEQKDPDMIFMLLFDPDALKQALGLGDNEDDATGGVPAGNGEAPDAASEEQLAASETNGKQDKDNQSSCKAEAGEDKTFKKHDDDPDAGFGDKPPTNGSSSWGIVDGFCAATMSNTGDTRSSQGHDNGKKGDADKTIDPHPAKMLPKQSKRYSSESSEPGEDKSSRHNAMESPRTMRTRRRLNKILHSKAARGESFGGSILSRVARGMREGERGLEPLLNKLVDEAFDRVLEIFGGKSVPRLKHASGIDDEYVLDCKTLEDNIWPLRSLVVCPISGEELRGFSGTKEIERALHFLQPDYERGEELRFSYKRILDLRQHDSSFQSLCCALIMPGATSAEELRKLRLPDMSLRNHAVRNIKHWDREKLLNYKSYLVTPPGLRGIFQIEARWMIEVCQDHSPELIDILGWVAGANDKMYSYELAALFMWWMFLPTEVRTHFVEWGWHKVSVQHSGDVINDLCCQARFCNSACPCANGERIVHYLRKFGNLKGRRLGEADWHEEAWNGTISYSMRYYGEPRGPWSRMKYLVKMRDLLIRFAGRVVNERHNKNMSTINDWWARRQMHTPSGSTSERLDWGELWSALNVKDVCHTSSDRPNKKAVAEVLPEDYVWDILEGLPMMSERCSTKMEPGLKLRALHAASDEATVIASYASEGIEKAMSQAHVGLMPLQEPADVADWLSWHYEKDPEQLLVSADYKDFNKEHSLPELIMVHLAMARAYLNEVGGEIGSSKALASCWLALATFFRVSVPVDGTVMFHTNGLWSGTRDTARDNTFFNRCYMQLAIDWLDEFYPGWGSYDKIATCGDDSVVRVQDQVSAMMLLMTLSQWWHLNPKKQLCSDHVSEFLQQMPHEERGCCGSVCSMIAAMCSGQWYKARGPSQDSAIDAISSQCFELGQRAGNTSLARFIAIRALQAYMQTSAAHAEPGKGKEKLEWWTYRFCVHELPIQYGLFNEEQFRANFHPLWCRPDDLREGKKAARMPRPFWSDEPVELLPGKATEAMLDEIRKALNPREQLIFDTNREYLRRHHKAESYGALHHAWLQKQRQEYIIKAWPRRLPSSDNYATMQAEAKSVEAAWARDVSPPVKREFVAWLKQKLRAMARSRVVLDPGAAAAKIGVSVPVLKLLEHAGEPRIPYWVHKLCNEDRDRTWFIRYGLDPAVVACLSPPLRALLLGSVG